MPALPKVAPGVVVQQMVSSSSPITGVSTTTAAFIGVMPESVLTPSSSKFSPPSTVKIPTDPNTVVYITNFTQFTQAFGDFSLDPGQNILAQAVYGFFNNGGTACYVVYILPENGSDASPPSAEVELGPSSVTPTALQRALDLLSPYDDIAMLVAPGITDRSLQKLIIKQCYYNDKNRFAILDGPTGVTPETLNSEYTTYVPIGEGSSYAAYYYPWIQVYDPATLGNRLTPPSGHMAGIYARVDSSRGVFKAPANEPIYGAVGLELLMSDTQQQPLNDMGVNCLRKLNGNFLVWGARTVGYGNTGSDDDLGFTYVNTRRLYIYIRGSLLNGTQWAVFEPNTPDLWGRITRNVTAFLTDTWNSGALFGDTAKQAFFVKCDAETNPPSQRQQGYVVTQVGVAMTMPAEFVVFYLGQWQPTPGS